jgi:hypothetical protein
MSNAVESARLLEALEMWDDGVQIMRENLRRRFPADSSDAIETKLAAWLEGPAPCDEERVLVPWPRPPK